MTTHAEIYVKMDLSKPIHENISIKIGKGSTFNLDYETIFLECKGCHEYGHLESKCSNKIHTKFMGGIPNAYRGEENC